MITGAAGQIGYSLIQQISNGDVFGKDQVGFDPNPNDKYQWGLRSH